MLKLGMIWPMPEQKLRDFAASVDKLVVVEELDPFIENHCRVLGLNPAGKELFPLLGEFSFSLYLIHLPFITLYLKTAEVGAWHFLPLRFVVLISLAACAHLLVTKLLIRLFRRLSPRLRAALCEKDSVPVS